MIFVYLLLGATCALALWLYRHYTSLSRRGIKHGPVIPLFGDMFSAILGKEHRTDLIMRVHNSFPGERLVGRYEFLTPYIIVRDRELLKRITVKDFDYFVDRLPLVNAKPEFVVMRSLLALKGDEWKDMRSTLSPSFTSSKIRLMVPFMMEVGEQMLKSLTAKIEQSKDGYIDMQAKDISTRFANDVIATCAFGLAINSQSEDSEFYKMSSALLNHTLPTKIKLIGYKLMPWILSALQIKLFPTEVTEYLTNVVLGAIKQREEQHIYRPDMIHLLMEAKKGKLSHDSKKTKDDDAGFATVEESDFGKAKSTTVWSDHDLVAQATVFLSAGYHTVSTTIAFILYELAVNPEYQNKLVQEIRENEKNNNGKFDYSSVQHMKYLDMVISETMRKWPLLPTVDRVCVKEYNLGKPNDQATEDVILHKGDAILVPIWAYHRDPKNFPDPEKFDPERFSEENKHNIDPFAYMPFGIGPRNCIGSRFALCELKVMVYQLLLRIEVTPCEKSIIPITLSVNEPFQASAAGGNWLRFRPRKN